MAKSSSGAGSPLPNSAKMVNNEMVGVKDSGFIDKKGTVVTQLNQLPPGSNIDNQQNADIRSMEVKRVTPGGYPGDGWT